MTAAKVTQLPAPEPDPPKKKPKKAAAVEAQEAEADDGFVTIEQRGIKLRVPVGGKLPIAAVDKFRIGDNYGGTREMLGPEQWKKLSDAGLTLDELDELGNKVQELLGN